MTPTPVVRCFWTASIVLRVATLLMHPVAPARLRENRGLPEGPRRALSRWNEAFVGMDELCCAKKCAAGGHAVGELPPRTDFFERHPSQFK